MGRRTIRRSVIGGLVALALMNAGCEGFLTNFAAGSSARIFSRAAPALQRWSDPDLAEAAIPGSIGTMEGLLLLQPQSAGVRETLARSYSSFAFGWLVDRMEEANIRGDEASEQHYRVRASSAFLRAKTIAFEAMSQWEPEDGGVEGHLRRLEDWRTYLAQFDRPEYAGIMFWAAYSWAQYISLNRDDVTALADLPYVNAMAERVLALDRTYNGFSPIALVSGLQGAAPQQMGGRPDLARQGMDEAIRLTERKNLMFLVLEARLVAVSLQDRRLFRSLLEEVINAGDIFPEQRLQNQLAKRRARRYLAQIDDLFPPEETPSGGANPCGGSANPCGGGANPCAPHPPSVR